MSVNLVLLRHLWFLVLNKLDYGRCAERVGKKKVRTVLSALTVHSFQ